MGLLRVVVSFMKLRRLVLSFSLQQATRLYVLPRSTVQRYQITVDGAIRRGSNIPKCGSLTGLLRSGHRGGPHGLGFRGLGFRVVRLDRGPRHCRGGALSLPRFLRRHTYCYTAIVDLFLVKPRYKNQGILVQVHSLQTATGVHFDEFELHCQQAHRAGESNIGRLAEVLCRGFTKIS